MRGICIDLGTSNVYISSFSKDGPFIQPSVVTIDTEDNIITDAGNVSKEAIGKTPENIITIKPLSGGVIADYSAAEGMIKLLVKKAFKRTVFTGINAIMTVPSNATQMERRATAETVKNLGVSTVYIIESSMASAVGAGINVLNPRGNMVVDIGGGNADIAVIALGTIATGACVKTAGDSMDSAIVAYVKRKYNIAIGENTAERIKIELGSAEPKEKNEIKKYKGRDILSGLPRELALDCEEIRKIITEVLDKIIDAVTIALEKTPPELLSDVMESGITLTGGCANIHGIGEYFVKKTGFKAFVADNPEKCTLRGAEKIFTDKKLKNMRKTI